MQAYEFNSVVKNNVIPIPEQYRNKISSPVTVILLTKHGDMPPEVSATERQSRTEKRLAALDRLIGLTKDNPVSLEEARAERLSRQ
jgi:hypothetical protein